MSLAAGPGRGGGGGSGSGQLPVELQLVTEKHVAYIQSLDTVRFTMESCMLPRS
jgi:geranylgeranyl transferase type-2 subunit beta